MFLASIGMASANPSTDTFGSNEPNPVVASPQQAKHTIKGVVEDQFGPIAGANVVEKGTTNGTITDMDGNFSLEVAPNSILIVSFIGYKEQQIPVNSQKTVTIKLTEDSQALEEVVVVGYGTQKKVNLSGSVTSVNVSEMAESRPLQTFQQLWPVLLPVCKSRPATIFRPIMEMQILRCVVRVL